MKTDDQIIRALKGAPEGDRQRSDNAVLEALGAEPEPLAGSQPLATRGDEFEATAIWASKEAAVRATTELAEAIMRADSSKNIYTAESEAKSIAQEAYAHAAQATGYEDDRHRFVEKATRNLAETMKARASESKPVNWKPGATSPVPLTATEARSKTITSTSRIVQITEASRVGRINNL